MQDIIITSKRIRKEIYTLTACFSTAFLINIISIIAFKTPWHEMFTQIGYVVVITIILYLIVVFIRLLSKLILTLLGNIKHMAK